jgi:GNAT superfamily N-acetyltransferase
MDVPIRPARPGEADRLREIAIAAKAHWGYDEQRVRAWGERLDFSPADVYVAEVDGQVAAFAAVVARGEVCELDHLWVDPPWIGRGLGARLFSFASGRAARSGARRLEWEAEPHAVGFYEKMGGRYLRDGEPSEWGRILPVMGIDL